MGAEAFRHGCRCAHAIVIQSCTSVPELAAVSAVGLWYADVSQTTDEEVTALLQDARGVGTALGSRS